MSHIINLEVNCKTATGDGTRIVCMNSDYVVRISVEDCGSFTTSPVKKLVIRHDREYQEVDITYIDIYGKMYWQATLPPLSYRDFVDLGVCGKSIQDVPIYTSKSARFACDPSVLDGTVVQLDAAPTLVELDITKNGTYTAGDHAADGFSKVNVQVAGNNIETRAINLDMASGDQIIKPTKEGYAMDAVRVYKPDTLRPEFIVKGVMIGGVAGEYEKKLTETIIYEDGEYTPPTGVDGFSKVKVAVAKSSREKTMRVGNSFTYEYTASAKVELDTTGIVQYSDNGTSIIVTAAKIGNCMVTVRDYDSSGNVVNVVYFAVSVTADGDPTLPIEVNSPTKMTEYLTQDRVGGILKYVGSSNGVYVNGALYIIEEV